MCLELLSYVLPTQVVDSFDAMDLKEPLLRGIYAYGFEKPSAIQQRAIMPCVKKHDVIAQAQSGRIDVQYHGFYVSVTLSCALRVLFYSRYWQNRHLLYLNPAAD